MAEGDAPTSGGISRKVMGLPMWAWLAIGGGVAVIYVLWRRHSTSAKSVTSTPTQQQPLTNDQPSGLATDQYESILALLRDIQSQEADEPDPTKQPPPVHGGNPPSGPGGPVKVPPPIPPPPAPTPTPAPKKTVTVGKWPAWNSTLSGIAKQEYGSESQYPKIFAANQSLIVGEEIRHGMTQAQAMQKKWLYPGEVLQIP
jgi:hypothetical protein